MLDSMNNYFQRIIVGDKMNMKGILKRNLKEKLNEFRKEEEA